jgi:hypothetical protein
MQSADSREACPPIEAADKSEAADKGPDDGRDNRTRKEPRTPDSREPRGIENEIAEADKKARTGSKDEPVRNTPPAGAWNDTSSD